MVNRVFDLLSESHKRLSYLELNYPFLLKIFEIGDVARTLCDCLQPFLVGAAISVVGDVQAGC